MLPEADDDAINWPKTMAKSTGQQSFAVTGLILCSSDLTTVTFTCNYRQSDPALTTANLSNILTR